MLIILKCYKLIGGRNLLVECEDNEKLKDFYTENKFEFLKKDEETKLLQYILTMRNVKLMTQSD